MILVHKYTIYSAPQKTGNSLRDFPTSGGIEAVPGISSFCSHYFLSQMVPLAKVHLDGFPVAGQMPHVWGVWMAALCSVGYCCPSNFWWTRQDHRVTSSCRLVSHCAKHHSLCVLFPSVSAAETQGNSSISLRKLQLLSKYQHANCLYFFLSAYTQQEESNKTDYFINYNVVI